MFEIDGAKKQLVLEHVKEEYGVSEQEFWCCWIVGEEHVQGDGDTAEAAINNMLMRSDAQRQGYSIHVEVMKIKGVQDWFGNGHL